MQYKVVNFRADRISGWLFDPDAPAVRKRIAVMVNGECTTTLICNVFRAELSADAFPTRNIGFLGSLPPNLWTGETHQVSLQDPTTGETFVEGALETPDARISAEAEVSGDVRITARGEVGGWVARAGDRTTVQVLVDGQEIFKERANQKKLRFNGNDFEVTAPPEFTFSAQVPPEYFDDEQHFVEVRVNATETTVAQSTLRLVSAHREKAALEADRLAAAEIDKFEPWRKDSSQASAVQLEMLSVTATFARASLAGERLHARLLLRVGEETAVLHPVAEPHGDVGSLDTPSQHYAAEIGAGVGFEQMSLFTVGDPLATTFDLRLGDEGGRRPAGVPHTLAEDHEGELVLSPAELDAGTFGGHAFHTAVLDVPVQVVLDELTEDGPRTLAWAEASEGSKDVRRRFGISTGSYSLPLPVEVLRRTSHLTLRAVHARGEEVLWEDDEFYPSNQFLLAQSLNTSSRSKSSDLVKRARQAGREHFVESFLGTYKYGQADLSIEDITEALNAGEQGGCDVLEPSSGAIWYWLKELRAHPGRIDWFTQTAVRNRIGDARDVLAYAASKGRFDFPRVHGLLESARIEMFRQDAEEQLRRDHWASGVLSLARYLYSAPRDEIDYLDALTLYGMLEKWRGLERIEATDRSYYGDLLIWRGEFMRAAAVLTAVDPDPVFDYSQNLLALNAVNPNVNEETNLPAPWHSEFNELLKQGGASGIGLPKEKVSFYALTSEVEGPHARMEDGPLVSVIVPIFEPSCATDVAVASLLGQTWGNLEVIIVDDCSPSMDEHGEPTGYREQLERYSASDSRVRVVFNQKNRGAYSVRNDGLDLARGEFVTVADKDDWHHPQQIEIQAKQLMENPELVANESNWIRVDEDLKFIMRSATGKVVYPSLPSLMFRREQVVRDLGYWDPVRKSGDSEFKSRLENFYGTKVEPVIDAPLAFALMDGANLTREDMGVGYLAPDRRAYLRGYKRWHRDIREEGADAFMPKSPQERRFVAPPSFLPRKVAEPPNYDVVFASEFGFLAGNSTSLFNEISVCLKAGLRVGVIPIQNGLIPSASKRQFARKVDDLVLSGQVDRLSLDVEASADLLIVRWPTAVQAVRDTSAQLKAGRAVVVSNHPPYEPSGERRSYDVSQVTRNVERLFGVRPLWAPQSEQIGAMLAPMMPASDLADFSWKGIIALQEEHARRNRFDPSRRPVIGRHGRDDAAKWPSDRAVFRQVYPVDGSAEVCILGGTKVPQKLGYLPPRPKGWEVYVFNEIEVGEYLAHKIDFFVYFHSDGWLEAFGMAIIEAMSYGVVCVLPQHFEPVFGDAAVYAEPHDVQSVVLSLWDASEYAEQQRLALEFVERECTPEAYVRRLRKLNVGV
ncbi:glycosyltransferase [Nesterenkonia natronophila]|uniref:Glycosyltransferase n=1 Tax=Nesterenkonia natronophila TaxID=2174932 RepID=A0A3A4F5E5_9MICC|nr:glycosyltransferase [Nesterenkonia natronophila]RJN32961.1 glycosyltransferase [Nesterenkonia natronophila]